MAEAEESDTEVKGATPSGGAGSPADRRALVATETAVVLLLVWPVALVSVVAHTEVRPELAPFGAVLAGLLAACAIALGCQTRSIAYLLVGLAGILLAAVDWLRFAWLVSDRPGLAILRSALVLASCTLAAGILSLPQSPLQVIRIARGDVHRGRIRNVGGLVGALWLVEFAYLWQHTGGAARSFAVPLSPWRLAVLVSLLAAAGAAVWRAGGRVAAGGPSLTRRTPGPSLCLVATLAVVASSEGFAAAGAASATHWPPGSLIECALLAVAGLGRLVGSAGLFLAAFGISDQYAQIQQGDAQS